jgi:RNA polymerase primary sigma factor
MTSMGSQRMLLGALKESGRPQRGGVARPDPLGVSPDATVPSGRSRPGISGVNNENGVRRLLEGKFEYVYDRGFDQPDAEARFLAPMPAGSHGAFASPRPLAGLSPCAVDLYCNATLLRPEEEAYLFLKMNYLKYRASKLREALDPSRARAWELAEIERLQGEAIAVKNHIVRSNLRLVVSIAKGRVGPDRNLLDLVSEGNLSLILAAEKFDVSRGFKFSTYASRVIMRSFSRTTVREISRRRRFVTGHQDLFEAVATPRTDEHGRENGRQRNQEAVRRMLGRLSDREREVIISRFGLEGAREKTLCQLGKELGITRQRVSQIELRAREKLRKFALEQGLDPTAA